MIIDNSGPKLAALYGLIPNTLGFCGPQQDKLKKFIKGKLGIPDIIPVLEKFEAAYAYYELIAQKNKIKAGPFNKKVVEAYWIGNELLEEVKIDDLRKMISENFSRPGLLSKEAAAKKAEEISNNSKPHHSFHILVLGSITGRVNFEGDTKLKDICRVGWGRVTKIFNFQFSIFKVIVEYQPLVENKTLKLGTPKQKEIFWDKNLIPKIKIGDWVSFHWNYLVQVLSTSEMANLKKYTLNTLKSL